MVTNPGLHCESEVDSVSTLTDIPTVKTVEVTDVAQYSAKVAVEVSDDSGLEVTERGVCYGFYNNPTIDDDHIQSGSGLGAFTVTLTELFAGMRYYVRAYATNSQGTAYGEQMSFETASGLPGVITSEITDIEWRSAKGGGEVLSEGGAEITQIGLCWATSHDPDVTGNHINLTYDYYIFTAYC